MATSSQAGIIVNERMDRKTTPFTLKWTIDKLSTLRKKSEPFTSVGITMRELGQDDFSGRWRIDVNPCVMKTKEGVTESYVGVFLVLTDVDVESVSYTGEKSVDAEFVISVTTGNDADVIALQKSPQELTFCKQGSWGRKNLVSHSDLFGGDTTPGLLQDDSLTIVIEVTMYGQPKAVRAPEIVKGDSLKLYQQFVRRQAEALASNPRLQSADFTIHSNDGQVFPTYRALLMSHSPVFAVMLSHNSEEKRLSRCELKDIDGETVGVLLDYVHGCDIGKVTATNAEKVLIMADKYELLDLRAVCEGILGQSATGENALHYLVLASQRNLEKLKEAALNVIPKNMGTVLKHGALQEAFQFDPELMQTIMEHCSKKVRLNDIA